MHESEIPGVSFAVHNEIKCFPAHAEIKMTPLDWCYNHNKSKRLSLLNTMGVMIYQ